MKREELIQSEEYWLAKLQIDLFNEVEAYMKANNLTRTQFAKKLGVSKGYVSQILNGEADHRLSKFVELALAIGLCPNVSFEKIDELLHRDNSPRHDITFHDIERSKNILANSGYLFNSSPVNKGTDDEKSKAEWEKIDFKKCSFENQQAS